MVAKTFFRPYFLHVMNCVSSFVSFRVLACISWMATVKCLEGNVVPWDLVLQLLILTCIARKHFPYNNNNNNVSSSLV